MSKGASVSDPRYAQLEEFKAKLFPERVCPECGRVANMIVTTGKRKSAWCYHQHDGSTDAWNGRWFHFELTS